MEIMSETMEIQQVVMAVVEIVLLKKDFDEIVKDVMISVVMVLMEEAHMSEMMVTVSSMMAVTTVESMYQALLAQSPSLQLVSSIEIIKIITSMIVKITME